MRTSSYTNESGSIIFCGRADRQIKVNGKRIELEGIENAALQVRGVNRSVAAVRAGNIILYCEGSEADEKTIRDTISEVLPPYMIPAAICILEHFPISSNGKICTSELPNVDVVMKQHSSSADDEISRLLIDTCKEILGCGNINTSDNFFALGGNSIKMIKLLAAVRKKYDVVLSIKDVFLNPYISDLHDMIEERFTGSKRSTEENVYRDLTEYPVSVSQQGLWVSEMLSPASTYTMNVYTRISGSIDEKRLKKASYTVLSSYLALNAVFDMNDDGVPVQKYRRPDSESFVFNVVESESGSGADEVLRSLNCIILDINEGPLYQCTLIKILGGDMIFNLTCHHIVCDEQSFIIIMNGIFRCYNALMEGRKPDISEKLPYAGYCVQSRSTEGSVEYWRERLTDENLKPVIFEALDNDRQNRVSFEILSGLYSSVRSYCSQNLTSEYMVLLTLMCSAVSELSGRDRFVVLSPYSDRINMGYEDSVGFFTKNTAIVFESSESENLADLLKRTEHTVLDSFENADYPFEELINRLGLSHGHSDRRTRIVFNMIDSDRREISGPGYTAAPFEYLKAGFENPTGLNIFAENINGRIIVNMMIHENYISKASAEKLKDIFISNITALTDM